MRERRLTVADKGWSWVVLAGSFGAHMVSGCFMYAVGVIHNGILERFNEDVWKTAWASSLYLGMVSLTGVLASALINRYSCRVTMIIGAVFMSTGFFICALVPSLQLVTLFFGGLGGLGAGMTYLAAVVVIGFNFHHKRNIASGIAVSGCGVGTFVLAPVVEASREEYGNRGFFYIIAGIALHQALFGSLFFPSELESEQIQTRHQDSISRNKYAILKNILHSFAILRNISLLLLCISMFLACLGIYLVYVHFPRYAIEMGSSPLNASFLMSVSGVCNCISRALAGIAASDERIDEIVLYFGTFGLLGVSTLLFPLYASTYGGQLVYAVFLGLYSGCCYSIINTLIIQFIGIEELATGFGICMFFSGVGSLIGPLAAVQIKSYILFHYGDVLTYKYMFPNPTPVKVTPDAVLSDPTQHNGNSTSQHKSAILDYGGSYETSFILAGLCITAAAVLGMAVAYDKRNKQTVVTKDPEIPTVSKTVTMELHE